MSIIEALVLGLIQGLTEFIPVSSSGHLLLAHQVFGEYGDTLAFDVALHGGTLLALLIYFRKDIFELLINLYKENKQGRLARLLIMATIPGALFGLAFNDYIEAHLRSPIIVAITLGLVAVLMLYVDRKSQPPSKEREVTTEQGLSVGVAQSLALVPGVSRSGITIVTGMFMGLSREQAARFSFLLAIPIIAGSALGIVLKGFDVETVGSLPLAVGVITSFGSGLLAIRFLLRVIGKAGLKPFAFYRIGLAVVVFVMSIL